MLCAHRIYNREAASQWFSRAAAVDENQQAFLELAYHDIRTVTGSHNWAKAWFTGNPVTVNPLVAFSVDDALRQRELALAATEPQVCSTHGYLAGNSPTVGDRKVEGLLRAGAEAARAAQDEQRSRQRMCDEVSRRPDHLADAAPPSHEQGPFVRAMPRRLSCDREHEPWAADDFALYSSMPSDAYLNTHESNPIAAMVRACYKLIEF